MGIDFALSGGWKLKALHRKRLEERDLMFMPQKKRMGWRRALL